MVFRTRRTQEATFIWRCFFSFNRCFFLYDRPSVILEGIRTIWFSPSNLLTDYMKIAGIGASLTVGSSACCRFRCCGLLMCEWMAMRLQRHHRMWICIVWENLFNSIPITLGVMLYARLQVIPFQDVATIGLSVRRLTSRQLAELWPGASVSYRHSGWIAGLLAGFVLPLSKSCINFHRDITCMWFTAGLIAMFAAGYYMLVCIETVHLLSSGNDLKLSILLFVFAVLLLYGLQLNNWLFRVPQSLAQSGRLAPILAASAGMTTLINVALWA